MRTGRSTPVRMILALMAIVLGPTLALADTKVALVIGNSKYMYADELKNPADDALAVKSALTKIGFSVILKKDVTVQEFEVAITDFASEAAQSDIALFYFAGHGVQFQGQNYFLPVDTKLIDSNDIEFNSIAIDKVIAAASKAHKTKIIILDLAAIKLRSVVDMAQGHCQTSEYFQDSRPSQALAMRMV